MTVHSIERRYPRIALEEDSALPVEVCSALRRPQKSRITVLGSGGAFLEACEGWPIGSVVQLRFFLPGVAKEVSCSAIVRSVVPDQGTGVEFSHLHSTHREHIVAAVVGASV